jgi:hypothetical protein
MDIIAELLSLKVKHYYCEDSWYSCPLAEDGSSRPNDGICDCGAEEHNAKVDSIIHCLKALNYTL